MTKQREAEYFWSTQHTAAHAELVERSRARLVLLDMALNHEDHAIRYRAHSIITHREWDNVSPIIQMPTE